VVHEVSVMMSTSTIAGTFIGVINIASSGLKGMVTVNGIVSDSTVTNVVSESQTIHFSLYPNPVINGTVYFSTSISGSIINALGIEVKILSNVTEAIVIDLPAGIYLVRTKENQLKKFVID